MRRTLETVLIALALALALVGSSCAEDAAEDSAETSLKAWMEAVRAQDGEAVWTRMSERSRAEALAVASLPAGTPEPWKKALMLDRLRLNWDILEIAEVAGTATADRVEYDIVGADPSSGKRVARITLVRESDTWRVDLPSPAGGTGAPAAGATGSPASSAPATATTTTTATAAPAIAE